MLIINITDIIIIILISLSKWSS